MNSKWTDETEQEKFYRQANEQIEQKKESQAFIRKFIVWVILAVIFGPILFGVIMMLLFHR